HQRNVSVYAAVNSTEASRLESVTLAGFAGAPPTACAGALVAGKNVTCKANLMIPPHTRLSTPYWTPRSDAARYDFDPDVPFGLPFRPSPFVATFHLTIRGERVDVERSVQFRYSHVIAGEPASAPLHFGREDEETTVTFKVRPPAGAHPAEFVLKGVATAGGTQSDLGYEVVEYPHIHRRHVLEKAETRAKVMDVKITPGLHVGYIMGVGDRVPEAIEQLGAAVRLIDPDTL